MTEIIFATKNKNKIKEINEIIDETLKEKNITEKPFKVISMEDYGLDIDVVEDGETFLENSLKKAVEINNVSKKIVLSDDSGLEIDFLDKQPGVYSARFMGEDTSYDIKNAKIIDMLKDVPFEKRTARFVCVISCALLDGKTISKTGIMEGYIATEPAGNGGFGYDPIFYLDAYKKTSSELTSHEKNKISHRGQALRLMISELIDNADKYL